MCSLPLQFLVVKHPHLTTTNTLTKLAFKYFTEMQRNHYPAQKEKESQTLISYQVLCSLSSQGRTPYKQQHELQTPLTQAGT